MRRSAVIATLLLPFAFAALPLLVILTGHHGTAGANGTLAITPSTAVTAVAPDSIVPSATTMSYGVSQPIQDECSGGIVTIQG